MFHVQTHPARVCRRRAAGLESRVLMKTATRDPRTCSITASTALSARKHGRTAREVCLTFHKSCCQLTCGVVEIRTTLCHWVPSEVFVNSELPPQ